MSESKLTYKDIWYGQIVDESNDVFEVRHNVSRHQFEVNFINGKFKIISCVTISPICYKYKIEDENGKRYDVIFTGLKHSGSADNRIRAHISPKVVAGASGEALYLVAAYNTGDNILFVSSEISDFVKQSSVKSNNSSFWIGTIDNLLSVYNKHSDIWRRKKDTHMLTGFDSQEIKTLTAEQIVNKFFSKKENPEDDLGKLVDDLKDDYLVEPEEFSEEKLKNLLQNKLERNKKYRDLALKKANYTCELCGKKSTFTMFNGKQYFDGHHLIMYNPNSQKRYDKSLDIPRNIVCLCPECHKKIHFSNDEQIKNMLFELFMKRRDLLELYEIESFDEIISDYVRFREEED